MLEERGNRTSDRPPDLSIAVGNRRMRPATHVPGHADATQFNGRP